MKTPTSLTLAILALGLSLAPTRAGVINLHHFTNDVVDGGYPTGSVTVSGSKLYGMTNQGGTATAGAIFSMNTDGTGFGVLHSFTGATNDGAYPFGSLTPSGSTLYGLTSAGGSTGSGTVFRMNTDGSGFGVLYDFSASADGISPKGSLALAGSKLYGMTNTGGVGDAGTVFSLETNGTGFAVLHAFDGGAIDGGAPVGSLTLSGSKLYGMTSQGGDAGSGTLFSVGTDGSGFALLHSFTGGPDDGFNPQGSLLLAGGKLYGMTRDGGDTDAGTLFSIEPDGTDFTVLHDFTEIFEPGYVDDGAHPESSLTLIGSSLYGMTRRGGEIDSGTVFRIGMDGTGFELLETLFDEYPEGAMPRYTDLVPSDDGTTLYGMTEFEGLYDFGTIFSLPLEAVPEPGTAFFGMALVAACANRRARRA